MLRLLSWNIGKRKTALLQRALPDVLRENDVEIAILQEAYGPWVNTALSIGYSEISYPGSGVGSGVRLFLKTGMFTQFSTERLSNKKIVLVHLKKNGYPLEFNIAAVHFYSKVNNTERQQMWKNHPAILKIYDFEKNHSSNSNTILVGDFNHNPYEGNLCDPYLLNCKDSRDLIITFTKNPLSKKRASSNWWYNPMYNLMGDFDYTTGSTRVTGTYFRYSESETPMWNLFDGFILRPTIMDRVDYKNSFIVTKTLTDTFMKPLIVRPDESLIHEDLSDHLPVFFSLNL